MKKILLLVVLSIGICSNAEAFFLVDTGIGSGVTSWGILGDDQRALKFTVPELLTVNTAEFYMYSRLPSDEFQLDVGISILSDNSNSPGSELFSGDVFITEDDDWYGFLFGQQLTAGDYWLSAKMNDPASDRILLFRANVPNPVEFGAYKDGSDPWQVSGSAVYDFGMRIDASPIPEPATMIIFGTGILGAFVTRKKIA